MAPDHLPTGFRPSGPAGWLARVAPALPPLALIALFANRWSNGWLLLLDTSPGPRSAPWSGPDLPVGIGLKMLVGAVAALDPALVGWAIPTAAVVVAYAGGHRLAQRWCGPRGQRISGAAAIVGGCVAAANPFVAARLYSGQIGVLWGYAVLWWLVAATLTALEDSRWRAWIAPGVWLAIGAAATVHMAVIGSIPIAIAGIVHMRRHGRGAGAARAGLALVLGAAITAAWLVPLIASGRGELGEAGGARAAHAFASGGPATTLWLRALGGAGFWRPLPGGALTVFGVLVALAWGATAIAWRHGSGHSRDTRHVLVLSAFAAVAFVYLGRGPVSSAWSWSVAHLWPAGLLREPGKLVMLAVLAPACGAAVATQRLIERHRTAGRALVTGSVVAVLVAWGGLADHLEPSRYPAEWTAARAVTDADECAIAVLGDGAYTNPGFTGGRVVAHPARGFLGPRAVVSNDAQMAGIGPREPQNDSERWATATNARYLDDNGIAPTATDAGEAGVGWVFVDRPVDRPALAADLSAGDFEPAYRTDRVDVWRVPGGCA